MPHAHSPWFIIRYAIADAAFQRVTHVSTILTFTLTEPGAPLQMPLRSYSLPKKSLKVPSRHCSSRHCLQCRGDQNDGESEILCSGEESGQNPHLRWPSPCGMPPQGFSTTSSLR